MCLYYTTHLHIRNLTLCPHTRSSALCIPRPRQVIEARDEGRQGGKVKVFLDCIVALRLRVFGIAKLRGVLPSCCGDGGASHSRPRGCPRYFTAQSFATKQDSKANISLHNSELQVALGLTLVTRQVSLVAARRLPSQGVCFQ
ncbi:hypothetical protein E2C01_049609 [Portunus trituberculatus]|uniref:Uncharacterized protein n=1 Tax=Portunus trituberculatus TaxID=210409 RepID=A0A5B7GEC2_PORTR|nr:hypothetical protein [Portunus trituberculatus]